MPDGVAQIVSICEYNPSYTIFAYGCVQGLGRCPGCYEDRNNGGLVTALVKVLEVECVVDGLIDSTTVVGLCPNLELDYQHHVAHQKNVVGPLANAGDKVFKAECSNRHVLE